MFLNTDVCPVCVLNPVWESHAGKSVCGGCSSPSDTKVQDVSRSFGFRGLRAYDEYDNKINDVNQVKC